MVHNISGVVLSGGVSKRFNGIIRAKIVIDGKTIISRIVETIDDIFDEIIIVTNTPDEFKEYNSCKIIGDQFLNKGPLGGIHHKR
jgi:molybdopterin-guanine dinucleotide biosynthesis protein A